MIRQALAQDLQARLPATHRASIKGNAITIIGQGTHRPGDLQGPRILAALIYVEGGEVVAEYRPSALKAAAFLGVQIRTTNLLAGPVRRSELADPRSLDRLDADLRAAGIPLAPPE